MQRILLALALVPFAVGSSSCGSIVGACTLIGCHSGIEVIVEDPPESPYRVSASVAGTTTRYVYECPSEAGCADRIFFPDYTPDRVFIEVTSAAGTIRYEVLPDYAESQPNGPNCPPLCRIAVIRLPTDTLS